jgi:hypothetical protein
MPIKGNENLHNSSICESNKVKCNEFKDNKYLLVFYLLYILYFIFSALQIKYNMIELRKKSILMSGDNLFYSVVYKVYLNVPFLYEIKVLIDWTFTGTSLDLWKYLKFESFYDILFIDLCTMKGYHGRDVGEKIPKTSKFFVGGVSFFVILLIVFGPLILFSNLNPTNKQNPIANGSLDVRIN